MRWKKNALSYGLWGFYVLAAGFVFCQTAKETGAKLGWEGQSAAIGMAGGCFLLIVMLYSGFSSLSHHLPEERKRNKKLSILLEFAIVAFILIVGVVLRVICIQYAGEEAAYYDAARVVEGRTIPQVAHGATYIYLEVLHGLFRIVGNQWMAGIWLQIFLQVLSVFLLYLGVRKLAGRVPAMVMAAFIMFDPVKMLEGLTYSPKVLYLCIYAAGLLCIAIVLKKRTRGKLKKPIDMLLIVLAGLLAAITLYLDFMGITLLLFALSIVWIRKTKAETLWENVLLEWGILAGSCVLLFVVFLAIDALISGKSFLGVLNAWLALYAPKGFDHLFWLREYGDYTTVLIASGFMMMGVFAYWKRRGNERISPWVLSLAVVSIIGFFQMNADGMKGAGLMYWLCCVLAGIGLADTFYYKRGKTEEKELKQAIRGRRKKIKASSEKEEGGYAGHILEVDEEESAKEQTHEPVKELQVLQIRGSIIRREPEKVEVIENSLKKSDNTIKFRNRRKMKTSLDSNKNMEVERITEFRRREKSDSAKEPENTIEAELYTKSKRDTEPEMILEENLMEGTDTNEVILQDNELELSETLESRAESGYSFGQEAQKRFYNKETDQGYYIEPADQEMYFDIPLSADDDFDI